MLEIPALSIDSLTVGYGSGPNVLEDLSITLPAGSLSCLLGVNGAGKSTLLKAIAGLIPFRDGNISVNGQDCRSSHASVGYLPQEGEVDWQFPVTVYDVVMMGRVRELGWLRFPRQRDRQVVDRALSELDMLPLRDRPISDLSGGQRRRVFLARSLAQRADLLLLDEPFTGVDMATRQELCASINLLNRAGSTVLVSTHTHDSKELPYDSAILLDGRRSVFGNATTLLEMARAAQEKGG